MFTNLKIQHAGRGKVVNAGGMMIRRNNSVFGADIEIVQTHYLHTGISPFYWINYKIVLIYFHRL